MNTVCNLNFSGYIFWTTRLKHICAGRYLIHHDELCDQKQVDIKKMKIKRKLLTYLLNCSSLQTVYALQRTPSPSLVHQKQAPHCPGRARMQAATATTERLGNLSSAGEKVTRMERERRGRMHKRRETMREMRRPRRTEETTGNGGKGPSFRLVIYKQHVAENGNLNHQKSLMRGFRVGR
jgi:hypothetical protein